MAIELVDFPINSTVDLSSSLFVYVYQAVINGDIQRPTTHDLPTSHWVPCPLRPLGQPKRAHALLESPEMISHRG